MRRIWQEENERGDEEKSGMAEVEG